MLSKSQISFVKSLHLKKFRKAEQLFIVEGLKSFQEFRHSKFPLHTIYATSDIIAKIDNLSGKQKVFEVTNHELTMMSTLKHPQGLLALFEFNTEQLPDFEVLEEMVLVLDGIQDPGNLGTIIRTADWYGFKHMICSEDTVEIFNPKVVQATMGSLTRVNVYYTDLCKLFDHTNLPIYGTLMNGQNIYSHNLTTKGFIIFGSEGNGISEKILPFIKSPITIPGLSQTESLNVGVAAAICMSELRRNMLK